MKVVALCQAYNEQLFIKRNLANVYDLVDQIIVTEGSLTPHGNLPQQSTDRTWQEILDFIHEKNEDKCQGEERKKSETVELGNEEIELNHGVRTSGKIVAMPAWQGEATTREKWEGNNKNMMLGCADLEDGDLIYILDADEFIPPHILSSVIEDFRRNDSMNCVRMREKQFAYGFEYYFPSSHPRFFRFNKRRRFTTTNHFVETRGLKPNVIKTNITRSPDKEVDGMFHFCWSKHPLLIREKVVSFNRKSFTLWFNAVYLVWPFNSVLAYLNNSMISPYYGKGFCEGMPERLRKIDFEQGFSQFPEAIRDLVMEDDDGIISYIKENHEALRIGPNYSDDDFVRLAKEGQGFWTPR